MPAYVRDGLLLSPHRILKKCVTGLHVIQPNFTPKNKQFSVHRFFLNISDDLFLVINGDLYVLQEIDGTYISLHASSILLNETEIRLKKELLVEYDINKYVLVIDGDNTVKLFDLDVFTLTDYFNFNLKYFRCSVSLYGSGIVSRSVDCVVDLLRQCDYDCLVYVYSDEDCSRTLYCIYLMMIYWYVKFEKNVNCFYISRELDELSISFDNFLKKHSNTNNFISINNDTNNNNGTSHSQNNNSINNNHNNHDIIGNNINNNSSNYSTSNNYNTIYSNDYNNIGKNINNNINNLNNDSDNNNFNINTINSNNSSIDNNKDNINNNNTFDSNNNYDIIDNGDNVIYTSSDIIIKDDIKIKKQVNGINSNNIDNQRSDSINNTHINSINKTFVSNKPVEKINDIKNNKYTSIYNDKNIFNDFDRLVINRNLFNGCFETFLKNNNPWKGRDFKDLFNIGYKGNYKIVSNLVTILDYKNSKNIVDSIIGANLKLNILSYIVSNMKNFQIHANSLLKRYIVLTLFVEYLNNDEDSNFYLYIKQRYEYQNLLKYINNKMKTLDLLAPLDVLIHEREVPEINLISNVNGILVKTKNKEKSNGYIKKGNIYIATTPVFNEKNVLFINVREEPLIYIHDDLFTLRNKERYGKNITYLRNTTKEKLNRIERSLKEALIKEVEKEGQITYCEVTNNKIKNKKIKACTKDIKTIKEYIKSNNKNHNENIKFDNGVYLKYKEVITSPNNLNIQFSTSNSTNRSNNEVNFSNNYHINRSNEEVKYDTDKNHMLYNNKNIDFSTKNHSNRSNEEVKYDTDKNHILYSNKNIDFSAKNHSNRSNEEVKYDTDKNHILYSNKNIDFSTKNHSNISNNDMNFSANNKSHRINEELKHNSNNSYVSINLNANNHFSDYDISMIGKNISLNDNKVNTNGKFDIKEDNEYDHENVNYEQITRDFSDIKIDSDNSFPKTTKNLGFKYVRIPITSSLSFRFRVFDTIYQVINEYINENGNYIYNTNETKSDLKRYEKNISNIFSNDNNSQTQYNPSNDNINANSFYENNSTNTDNDTNFNSSTYIYNTKNNNYGKNIKNSTINKSTYIYNIKNSESNTNTKDITINQTKNENINAIKMNTTNDNNNTNSNVINHYNDNIFDTNINNNNIRTNNNKNVNYDIFKNEIIDSNNKNNINNNLNIHGITKNTNYNIINNVNEKANNNNFNYNVNILNINKNSDDNIINKNVNTNAKDNNFNNNVNILNINRNSNDDIINAYDNVNNNDNDINVYNYNKKIIIHSNSRRGRAAYTAIIIEIILWKNKKIRNKTYYNNEKLHLLLTLLENGRKACDIVNFLFKKYFETEIETFLLESKKLKTARRTLKKYFLIICFASFIISKKNKINENNNYNNVNTTFEKYMLERKEIRNILKSISKINIKELQEDEKTIKKEIDNRKRQFLGPKMILKNDYFVGSRYFKTDKELNGTQNFRYILNEKSIICGLSIPTEKGIKNTIKYIQKISKNKNIEIYWFCLREEPVIYINKSPYVLRNKKNPYNNLELTGISTETIEKLEKNLINEIKNKKNVHIHDEILTENKIENIIRKIKIKKCKTTKETYNKYNIFYKRIPITDEKAPLPGTIDRLHKIFTEIKEKNCINNDKKYNKFNASIKNVSKVQNIEFNESIISNNTESNIIYNNQTNNVEFNESIINYNTELTSKYNNEFNNIKFNKNELYANNKPLNVNNNESSVNKHELNVNKNELNNNVSIVSNNELNFNNNELNNNESTVSNSISVVNNNIDYNNNVIKKEKEDTKIFIENNSINESVKMSTINDTKIENIDENIIEVNESNIGNTKEENLDIKVALLFNCQIGRGRTTTGMILAYLTLNHKNIKGKKYKIKYKIIGLLVKILYNAEKSKNIADEAIDKMSHLQNIREAIEKYEKIGSTEISKDYLIRYFYILCFSEFLISNQRSFLEFLEKKQEIGILAKRIEEIGLEKI